MRPRGAHHRTAVVSTESAFPAQGLKNLEHFQLNKTSRRKAHCNLCETEVDLKAKMDYFFERSSTARLWPTTPTPLFQLLG